MAADEGSNQTKASERGFCKTPNLNVTIGAGDDDDPDAEEELEMFDMRSRMQSFALDDGSVMPPTIFVDDSDLMLLPTTSSSLLQESSPSGGDVAIMDDSEPNMQKFVKDFFAADNRLFQAPDAGNFVEEIYTEKPPKFIGDYLFGNVIGEGSYSKVKEILHTKTLERRAVKIIKDKRLRKIPGGEQNVQREIEVLKRIHHVNVVELFEVFRIEEKQKLYIVMEFCVCSLQQMLDNCEEKKLPEFQAHIYFTQMIDGLDYLHAQGIIHKDIKPGNLLLSLDGKVKICDMGVAEVLHDGQSQADPRDDWCTTAQGTPKFQPPEVVSGSHRRFRGRPVDIWACGVTLFNAVSGEYPFEGDVIMKLFENITTQPLRLPTTIKLSDSLAKLLHGMLEKHPEKRWNTVRIRQSDWFTRKHEILDYCLPQFNVNCSTPQLEREVSSGQLNVKRAPNSINFCHLLCSASTKIANQPCSVSVSNANSGNVARVLSPKITWKLIKSICIKAKRIVLQCECRRNNRIIASQEI